MPEKPATEDTDLDSVTAPAALARRFQVAFDEETQVHEADEHPADGGGEAVAGVTDEDGDLLLLVNREHGVALLPHAPVDAGGDWADAARDGAEGQTGIAVELESVAAVRRVVHVAEGADDAADAADAGPAAPLATTHRVVFEASPVGGAIDDCKRDAAAGSDRWVAGWYGGLPEGVSAPGGAAGDDLRLFLDCP